MHHEVEITTNNLASINETSSVNTQIEYLYANENDYGLVLRNIVLLAVLRVIASHGLITVFTHLR